MPRENLNRGLHTHVTDVEGELIERVADDEGRSISALIRRATLEYVKARTVTTSAIVVDAQPVAEAEIKQLPQRHFESPASCRHPINRRIGDSCGECGKKFK